MSDSFPFEVHNSLSFAGVERPTTVEAFPTDIDFILAHESFINEGKWELAHGPTGSTLVSGMPDKETAFAFATMLSRVIDVSFFRTMHEQTYGDGHPSLGEKEAETLKQLLEVRDQICPDALCVGDV